MSEKNRRKFKQQLTRSSSRSTGSIALKFFALTLFVFLAVQIGINAILSPMGVKLEAFNDEKVLLLEENRTLEQSLANMKSIKALNHLSAEKLNLQQTKSNQLVYINDISLRAEK